MAEKKKRKSRKKVRSPRPRGDTAVGRPNEATAGGYRAFRDLMPIPQTDPWILGQRRPRI